MPQTTYVILLLLGGLVGVTIIATAGAYASRRFNFNYGILTIASFIIYVSIGFLASRESGLSMALLINLLIGIYDATACWKLSRRLNANTGLSEDELRQLTMSSNLTIMLIMTGIFTYIGYLFS